MDKYNLKNLDRRVGDAEKRTGAQIVLAVIARSDSYPELPWKAFALGAAIAGLLVALQNMARPEWTSALTVYYAVAVTLGAGISCAMLCLYLPLFARLFLDRHRADDEVRQYASALFLSREMFNTTRRTGILLLVSLFERHVVVLPDTGLRERLSPEALQTIIARITAALKQGRVERALEDGLNCLVDILAASATGEMAPNELANTVIEEKVQ